MHSVLKQQKTKGPSEQVNETDKLEKERLERAIDQLKAKLQETRLVFVNYTPFCRYGNGEGCVCVWITS